MQHWAIMYYKYEKSSYIIITVSIFIATIIIITDILQYFKKYPLIYLYVKKINSRNVTYMISHFFIFKIQQLLLNTLNASTYSTMTCYFNKASYGRRSSFSVA